MKIDWKVYAAVMGLALIAAIALFIAKIFYLVGAILATLLLALLLGVMKPVKYLGIELVTLSTILIGIMFGSLIGAVYGAVVLIAHLILGRYYIGPYLLWLLPEYALIGVVSGVMGNGIISLVGVSVIAGMNFVNLFLTFLVDRERVGPYVPYVLGNVVINSLLLMQVMPLLL
ncbi:MAG: hypothetical protein HYT70_00765 [Candidatus Aenigmarchaeota archaeon]|nr:hypothetical protein [Candidatus Aenigmarchaeota archaeon]